MNKFKSRAEWPKHPDLFVQYSEDTHATKEQADAVCQMLQMNGFGGDGKIFPVLTWVEEIN